MKNLFFLLLILSTKTISAQMDCSSIAPNYTGFCAEKHPNGKTSWVKEYKEGKAVGTWKFYNENGELSKEIAAATINDSLHKIEQGKISNSQNTQESSNEEVIEEIVINEIEGNEIEEEKKPHNYIYIFTEVEPIFNGDMNAWLVNNLRYPVDAKKKGLEGRCYVKFVVEKNGKVSNIVIVKGVPNCSACDEEVIRVIKLMPKWKAGKNKGKKVRSWVQIPFNFTLK